MAGFFKSRLFFVSLAIVVIASTLPLYVSGYVLGLLTVAYYFGVFAMSWDLLFGFAGEVNFGPTFLIGVGAYTAGILNNQYGWSVYLCIVLGALASVVAGFVLAMPTLRQRAMTLLPKLPGRLLRGPKLHKGEWIQTSYLAICFVSVVVYIVLHLDALGLGWLIGAK